MCFFKTDGHLVTFDAKKTAAPCGNNLSRWNVVAKTTNGDEVKALKRLTKAGAVRVPSLLHVSKIQRGRKFKIRMTDMGTALTALGGRRGKGGKQLVQQRWHQLVHDLYDALAELKAAGIQHLDLHPRNITWDGSNFNIIDFDHVAFHSSWGINNELQQTLDALASWSQRKG